MKPKQLSTCNNSNEIRGGIMDQQEPVCRWCTEFVHEPGAKDADNSKCHDLGTYTDDEGTAWSLRYHSKSLSQVLLADPDQRSWPWRWVVRMSDGRTFGESGSLYFHDLDHVRLAGDALIEIDRRIIHLSNERLEAAFSAVRD